MARKERTESEPAAPQEAPAPVEGMHLRSVLKALFALAGTVLGLSGVVLSIFFYFTALSAINSVQSAFDLEITSVTQTLSDLDGSLASAEQASGSMGDASGNMSAAVSSLSSAAGGAAGSFDNLAASVGAVPLIPAGTADGLSASARDLRNASFYFGNASSSFGGLAANAAQLKQNMSAVRADVANSRTSLAAAQAKVGGSFGSLRFAVLLLSLMLLIAFVVLAGYSVSILL